MSGERKQREEGREAVGGRKRKQKKGDEKVEEWSKIII